MSLVAETATLVHGYTMADLEKVARIASRNSFSVVISESDRYEAAWGAAAELLYSSRRPPTFRDLLNAGREAIGRERAAYLRHRGVNKTTLERAPQFQAYWGTGKHGRWPTDFTEEAAERLALPQVLGLLTPEEYQAIAALAATGSIKSAAVALGVNRSTLDNRIQRARERIIEAWFAPDRPPRAPGRTTEQCRWGHLWEQHGFREKVGRLRCRECRRRDGRRRNSRDRTRVQSKIVADQFADEAETVGGAA